MWHTGTRVIQDPIHGMMQFVRSEAFVLDLLRCAEVQRLRRIRQLGFACFVFPGAEHSRFSHAVGTAYLAARVGRQLKDVASELFPQSLRPDQCAFQDFCVAALCHDLGHGPFSHVWERVVIGEHWNRQRWAAALGVPPEEANRFDAWHEMVTHAVLCWPDGQLRTILDQSESGRAARISNLLTRRYFLPYISRLIAGDIDVDRFDYLLRDARMAGLPSCSFQLDRLIACLTFGFDRDSRIWVGIEEEKGLPVAVELLNARVELHQVLYFHKTILGMEWLLGNLLKRLRDLSEKGVHLRTGGIVQEGLLKMIRGEAVGVEAIMELDDYAIWMLIRNAGVVTAGDPTSVELARRLLERDPLKAIRVDSQRLETFFTIDPPARHEMVAAIVAKYVEGDPHYFFREYPVSFTLWEDKEESKTFLISSSSERRTKLLSEHPRMHELFPRPTFDLGHKLFVPREARDEVERLLTTR